MQNFALQKGVLGYQTASDETTIDGSYLVAGSQNVIINRQRKFGNRAGYSRLGAGNTALTPVRNSYTWDSNTGLQLPVRFYDDELEVYLGTVDGTDIDAWTRVKESLSTTAMMRFATWWDTGENLDLLLYVIGDSTINEWGGGVAVVTSITGTTITKAGTNTFAQNRFYTARNMTLVNVRTGTEYTYTGGATTTTLTGIADTTGIVAGDTLVQKVVVRSSAPAAGYNADTIYNFQNHILVSSDDNNDVYMSKNTSYYDFTFAAPRISGEGELFSLDNPCKGFGTLSGKFVMFCGKNDRYVADFQEITVGSTLTESVTLKKYSAANQSAQSQEVIEQIGDALAFLSYEPALYILESADALKDAKPRQVSSPIKPDFDAEDWTSAHLKWGNSRLHLSSSVNSKLYILDYVENEKGEITRFWQPPQILPIRSMGIIDGDMHFHSNSVPETYKMFDGLSDGYYDGIDTAEKLPINAIAKKAYFNGGKRANWKNFDEYYIEGEISRNTTELAHTLNYESGGAQQQIVNTIDGSDDELRYETVEDVSLGQNPLGQKPIGGAISQANETAKFRVIFEIAKDDFYELQEMYQSDSVDVAWTVIASGSNASLSTRQNSIIKR
jgi:hypothetical protein